MPRKVRAKKKVRKMERFYKNKGTTERAEQMIKEIY